MPVDDASSDALLPEPWGEPQFLMDLNTTMEDADPELRGDGLEIVFHSTRTGALGGYDLYHATRSTTTSPFGPVQTLTEINSDAEDLGPGLSGDGLTIVFCYGQDIVFATRPNLTSPFGARQALPALSSPDVDTAPEISGDGRIAIVTRGVNAAREMWMYERSADGPVNTGWSTGRQLVELSSTFADTSADLDKQGLVVFFHSDRLGSFDDLYMATRNSVTDPFDPPMEIPELMSPGDDGDPSVSADGKIMVFHRGLDLVISTR